MATSVDTTELAERMLALSPNQRVHLMRKLFSNVPSDSWLKEMAKRWDSTLMNKMLDELNFCSVPRWMDSSPFLFKEGFQPTLSEVKEIPQFVASLDASFGNSDLLLANLDILIDHVQEQKCPDQCCVYNNKCSCQYCTFDGDKNPLERPTYMLYYQAEAPVPTIVCLNHLTTLICTECRRQCEDKNNLPDPYDDVQEGFYFSPIKVGDKTFMSWLCKNHPGHYGVCPDCEKAGVFCYYLVRYVNNFCHFSLIRPCKTFDMKNGKALNNQFEVQRAYLTGLLLNLLQHKQYFSSLMYILFMKVNTWEDAVGVLDGKLTDDSYFYDKDKIKRDLCAWKSPTFLFHERLMDIFNQLNPAIKHQSLTRKIQKLHLQLKKKSSDQDTLQQQLEQLVKEKLQLQKDVTQLKHQLQSPNVVRETEQVVALKAANQELRTGTKQLKLELGQQQQLLQQLHQEKKQLERERDSSRHLCQDLEKKLERELQLRKNVEQHKLNLERNLAKLQNRTNQAGHAFQQQVKREVQLQLDKVRQPLLAKIKQLQQGQKSQYHPRRQDSTSSSVYTPPPDTHLSDYFRK